MKSPEELMNEAFTQKYKADVEVAKRVLDWAVAEVINSLTPAHARTQLDTELAGTAAELVSSIDHEVAMAHRVLARAKELLERGLDHYLERTKNHGQA